LGLVERADEEWMVNTLDGADFARGIRGCNAHPMLARDVLDFWRQPIRTRRVLDYTPRAVQPFQERAGRDVDRDRLVQERAFEERDYRRSAGAVFGVGGITNPTQVPCVLDEHVLKATSSTHQRDVPLARLSHHGVGRIRVAVRGAGPDDDRRSNCGDPSRVTNRFGGYDLDLDRDPAMLRRMSERSQGRAMVLVVSR